MMKKSLAALYDRLLRLDDRVPASLSANYAPFSRDHLPQLRQMIVTNLLMPLSPSHHQTPQGKADIDTHVDGRLNRFRAQYIPWLDAVLKLRNSAVLEIGCGTGASTQALCEQGARVTGIDIDERALEIARFRLKHSGQDADLHIANSVQLSEKFSRHSFDAVIFFASLEHMTTEERILSLQQAVGVLKPGGFLFVLEAPNRLWFYDMHTAFMPFYFWLPDDLAARYAHKSDRSLFGQAVNAATGSEELARWGRGVSYHEFELAGLQAGELRTATSLFDHRMRKHPFKRGLYRLNLNHRYKKILGRLLPAHISRAFLEPFLDLAIRKI